MPIPLTTLEGINPMVAKLHSRHNPWNKPRPGNTHLASVGFSLYGSEDVDPFGPEPLGGWWTDLKKGTSAVVSTVGDVGSSIVRPVASIAAETFRTVAVPAGQAVGAAVGTAMGTGGTPAPAGQGAGAQFLDSGSSIMDQISSLFGKAKNAVPSGVNADGQLIYGDSQTPNWVMPAVLVGGGILAYLAISKKRR